MRACLVPLLVALPAGCGSSAPLTFSVDGVGREALAYYSIAVEPLPSAEGGMEIDAGEYVVVTLVDAGYACADAPPSGQDAISFFFVSDQPGASSSLIAGRSGPTLGVTTAGDGALVIDEIDDRYIGFDNDRVDVVAGGHVGGHVHFAIDRFVIDGRFVAPHCAALDFIVPG